MRALTKLKDNYNMLHLSTGFTLTSENYKHALIVQRISYRHGADFSIRPLNVSEHYYQNLGDNADFNPEDVWKIVRYIAQLARSEKGMTGSITMLARARFWPLRKPRKHVGS